ncbi:hypothetical protein R0137_11020 [Congregibacter brevis]|uniref:Homeodomain-like domain-containing protein n=1 Tax=Congregibacter brevis TaxID=3081201 RepID=A0ABZ0I8C5_9GAMM|nr:hypothetical protein R0137_11020 [Congregibacter sp. IMCC45268]
MSVTREEILELEHQSRPDVRLNGLVEFFNSREIVHESVPEVIEAARTEIDRGSGYGEYAMELIGYLDSLRRESLIIGELKSLESRLSPPGKSKGGKRTGEVRGAARLSRVRFAHGRRAELLDSGKSENNIASIIAGDLNVDSSTVRKYLKETPE